LLVVVTTKARLVERRPEKNWVLPRPADRKAQETTKTTCLLYPSAPIGSTVEKSTTSEKRLRKVIQMAGTNGGRRQEGKNCISLEFPAGHKRGFKQIKEVVVLRREGWTGRKKDLSALKDDYGSTVENSVNGIREKGYKAACSTSRVEKKCLSESYEEGDEAHFS